MVKIALFGAGGKMGTRLTRNLKNTDFIVAHVELSPEGQQRLKHEFAVTCVTSDEAIKGADVVVLAVPDATIGKVAGIVVPKLGSGTVVICLDPAAPFAGHLPERADIAYFVTHPCHPGIFRHEETEAAQRDFFGGTAASQSIVNSLVQGTEWQYERGDQVARAIFAPVARSHRVSVEHMAYLEPGLTETVCASLITVLREAMEEVIGRGIDRDCAREFLLGHMSVLTAVMFDEIPGKFSDACEKAIEFGRPMLIREDWKKVFEPEEIRASIERIT
ncbi:phosphogluconate dehydrogenase C-terminal domain-containing protein [Brucella thiophenivorans]|uniref:Semialdehyde dehydrogenase n=1 Tax=Brucella thiophenivorans TaxID=571255 RepID=A0A256FC59_9HYPH|nr:phosphogluconate dehydrogenase C-terminal domain-containing protein [Brucella thiophenivorans]OYR12256.1 hypothetical protein CEV31_3597 [Brucella thiophenivorans]